jgi:general stress protein 26
MKQHVFLLFFAAIFVFACKPTEKIPKLSSKVLDVPSFKTAYQSSRNTELLAKRGSPSGQVKFILHDTKEQQKDISQWMKDNGLTLPAFVYHDGALLAPLKKMKTEDWTAFRTYSINKQVLHLAQIIEQEDVVLMIYGSAPNEMHVIVDTWALVVRDRKTKAVKYTFDFSNYRMAPEFVYRDKDFVQQDVLWAQLEDGILYVAHAHWTYAESSRNMNAYITAIDAAKQEVLWRSQPLVSNAVNFQLKGEHIYTAYAFTQENAMVYALHKANGEIAGKIELEPKSNNKKFIEYLIFKGNDLYVHCSDKAYILRTSN